MNYEQLGYMGRFAREYKQPVVSVHRLVNNVFGESPRRLILPSAIVVQQKKIPDISFWQGEINYYDMRQKTDALIIRAGQNLWKDSQFDNNWRRAKEYGIKRGSYFFYDDRVSPGKQAALWASLLRDDYPEMEIWCDWENSYGGAYKGLANVVAFMQAVEQLLPGVKIGLYTGYWWFRDNSDAVMHVNQYAYLRSRPLFEAWYAASASSVLIPAPWNSIFLWQFGTPAVGKEYGAQSEEIDMSYINMTEADFDIRYGGVIPPVEGAIMTRYEAVSTYTMSLRPDHNTANTPLGSIPAQSKIHGDVIWEAPGEKWLQVIDVNGVAKTGWVAIVSASRIYCALTDNGTPPVVEVPDFIVAHFANGVEKKYVPE
jgi:GH25 family lysozyme M1 (1,4-beta-N-acetylmuramidase)